VTRGAATPAPRVAVLSDDLIWSTRLVTQVRAAGADPVPVRDLASFRAALSVVEGAIVDLTARAYDGPAALGAAADAGVAAVAVGQHDDAPLRRRAREAGARHVYAYRTLFEGGPGELGTCLRELGVGRGQGPGPGAPR
jgi:hypothetical protein